MAFDTRSSRYESRRKLSEKRSSSFFSMFLVILMVMMGVLYVSIQSVGSLEVGKGAYTLVKGATLSSVPKVFNLDIADTRYKLWTRFFAPEVKLQAGTYQIEKDTSLEEIFSKILTKPTHKDLTITILPGWNIYDIDASLSEKNILKTGDLILTARDRFSDLQAKYPFLKNQINLEGFLYPDTYRIFADSDAYTILDRLLAEWQKKIYPTYQSLGEKAYNELILASIVEREERVKSEQSIVAGILAKRVREGMAMGADATVCYEYAKTQKQCTPEFIGSIITEKTPYNTRNKLGYPPTPISSVSLSTWESVLAKEVSPYYYYLHDNTGQIHYAKTLEEHNVNKRKYIQ